MIIAGSWIFSLILNSPLFLVFYFDKKSNSCKANWLTEWMSVTFTVTWWLVVVAPSIVVMTGLYSKVVYTLWFKRNDVNQRTYQQKVSVKYRIRKGFLGSDQKVKGRGGWGGGGGKGAWVTKFLAFEN